MLPLRGSVNLPERLSHGAPVLLSVRVGVVHGFHGGSQAFRPEKAKVAARCPGGGPADPPRAASPPCGASPTPHRRSPSPAPGAWLCSSGGLPARLPREFSHCTLLGLNSELLQGIFNLEKKKIEDGKERGKKKRKGDRGQPEQARPHYPLKLEYSGRCFYFRPVLLSFQSIEISSKVIIHLITLIV